MRTLASLLLLIAPLLAAEPELDYYDSMTHATGKHADAPKAGIRRHSAAGRPGDAAAVSATVTIRITEAMSFEADQPLVFAPWQTVRFVIRNDSGMPHQFALGTANEHQRYRKLLRSNPALRREERENLRLLAPGEEKTLIWLVAPAQALEAACNFPGHYQAGLRLPIQISATEEPHPE